MAVASAAAASAAEWYICVDVFHYTELIMHTHMRYSEHIYRNTQPRAHAERKRPRYRARLNNVADYADLNLPTKCIHGM